MTSSFGGSADVTQVVWMKLQGLLEVLCDPTVFPWFSCAPSGETGWCHILSLCFSTDLDLGIQLVLRLLHLFSRAPNIFLKYFL